MNDTSCLYSTNSETAETPSVGDSKSDTDEQGEKEVTDFSIHFIVPAKSLGDVLVALQPFKITNLESHIVIRKGAKGREGGATAIQTVADFVNSQKGPVLPKAAADVLEQAGFKRGGVSTHLRDAVERKLIRKNAQGYFGVKK